LTNSLTNKTVLVTGASGFLGAHLVRALLRADAYVTVVVRRSTDLWRLKPVLAEIELRDGPAASDFVFHLAAGGVHPGASRDQVLQNIPLTLDLLEASERFQPARFVYTSSCFEYPAGEMLAESVAPAPRTLYGASKAAAGTLVQGFAQRIPVVNLRLFTLFGPMEPPRRLIPSAIRAGLAGEAISLTGGEQTRDFVYVQDAVSAMLRAATADLPSGETINIASGRATAVRDAVEMIQRRTGGRSELRFGAIPYRPDEPMKLSGNPGKAELLLGWRATTAFETGIDQTIAFARAAAELQIA
jgi:nucleoside-diphosphate-sugar epimerase